MAANNAHLLFISYTRGDAAQLANKLARDLPNVWLDTLRVSGGALWCQEIEAVLDHPSTVVIALLSPAAYRSEICRAEHLRALRNGRLLIPIFATPNAERPLYLEARHYRDFSNDSRYAESLAELRADIAASNGAVLAEPYSSTRSIYVTAPPRVANYLERPDELRALRQTLFSATQLGDKRQPIALAGMGGIGKTVLAKALADDEVVRQAFPDGVVWITAGRDRQRNFIAEMREVAKALGDDPSLYNSDLACEHQYRTAVANKAALIVVDDVWSVSDVQPLLAESPRSRFLFTTRDASIGRFLNATLHTAELLERHQARQLLAAWAHLPVTELPGEADAIIGECRDLPLALSLVGAMLRGADSAMWRDTIVRLRNADISSIEDQLPPGQESFFRAVEVSYRALNALMQDRYLELAVLLEDWSASLPILQTLWGVGESEARKTQNHFVDRSLATRDEHGLRLHDLQLDYIRARSPVNTVLPLIRGAMRLSAHAIDKDPLQFASQIVGRLLPCSALIDFREQVTARATRPWIRPAKSALQPPGSSLIRTLEGHSAGVCAVAVTTDGQRAVSASADGTLRIWDLETGRQLRTLEGHSVWMRSVALFPDGRHVVSNSDDSNLKLWDLDTGREVGALRGHSGRVTSVAVSPDGLRAVSGSEDMTLNVWDLTCGGKVRTLHGHSGPVRGVAISLDGCRALSGSEDQSLRVWDLPTGCEICCLKDHAPIRAVALTPSGRYAISAFLNELKVWDLEAGRELRTLKGHHGAIAALRISSDGHRAISASLDGTLKLWDLDTGRELCEFTGHSGPVAGVALTPDGERAVSASQDRTLKVWDLTSKSEVRVSPSHSRRLTGVAVSANGQVAVSVGWDAALKIWDLETRDNVSTLQQRSAFLQSVCLTPDGRLAVSASQNGTLAVWELAAGRELRTFRAHSDWVTSVAVCPDGRRGVSASYDRSLRVWDLATGDELRILEGHSNWVSSVAICRNGRCALSGSWDRTLRLWDLETGHELRILKGHSNSIVSVATCPDGRRAVSGSQDGTLRLWNLETGDELLTLQANDAVKSVTVCPDGRYVASASSDASLTVWNLETGGLVATFTADAELSCCAFPDPKTILAGDALGHLHFLKLELFS